MSTCASFPVQVASIMDVLTKTAVAEIVKLVNDGSAALRLEMRRNRREILELKGKLRAAERVLGAVRSCGAEVAGNGSVEEQISTDPPKDDQNIPVERNTASLDALVIKYELVDWEQGWSGSLVLSEDELEEDTKGSQSQAEQEISEENTYGTLGTTAGIGGGGPIIEKRVLQVECKQELEGLDDDFSSPKRRGSRRLRSANDGPASHLEQKQNSRPRRVADNILAKMASPAGSPGECDGSAMCEASSGTSAEAKSPCKTVGQEEEFICAHCGKMFLYASELKTHVEQHRAQKRFTCSECGQDFDSSHLLEKHEQVHSREKPFSCSVCDKSFSQWHVLQVHERTHTGQKPYVCAECGKRFLYKGYLKTHQRVHTREKPFTCEHCGKSFSQISNLKTHQVTHTGKKCFSCKVCSKTFAHLHVLKHHQRIHSGERSLNCRLCGKLFDSADSLKQHRSTHHREKQFRCAACGKDFTAKSSLQAHQSVHTGEKPYSCHVCGKSFSHQCNLKTHQRIHTGEKPYSCTLCGRSFTQNHVLQKHMRTHS